MSGWRQAGLCALAVLVAALDLVPVELQRRIIDDAVTPGNVELLVRLGLLYAGVVVVHQLLKWLLRMAQVRIAESAAMYTRAHALGVRVKGAGARRGVGHSRPTKGRGESAVVLGNDIDKLAGFVGEGPSNAAAATATLLGVFGYMLWTEPRIALVAALLLAPQAVAAPFFQRRINTLTAKRVRLLRDLGERTGDDPAALRRVRRLLPRVYVNRMALTAVKTAMKGVLNLLNQGGPLAALVYGGWLVAQGETTVGVIVAFVSAFQRASDPLRELLGFYRKAEAAQVQHDLVAEWMTESGDGRDEDGDGGRSGRGETA
jgi:ABC-type multidrug transport system fused ATPase/permease subunit